MDENRLDDGLICPICGAEQEKHSARYKCPGCKAWLYQQTPLEAEILYCQEQNSEWERDGKPYRTYAGYLYSHRCLTQSEHYLSGYYRCLLREGISPSMIRRALPKFNGDLLATLDFFADHLVQYREKVAQAHGWAGGVETSYSEDYMPWVDFHKERAHRFNG